MKKYTLAALLLLIILSAGMSFAEDPWGPRIAPPLHGDHSWMDWFSDAWQAVRNYF